jgi:uncharacterized Zn finger protein
VREKEGDWLRVAAFRAEDFFLEPTFTIFQELRKAAEQAEVWPTVRGVVMNFLEVGELPRTNPPWPLPETGLIGVAERPQMQFPLTDTLIDIAIAEKRPDDVIRWYDQRKSRGMGWPWSSFQEERIAEASVEGYPERALEIWKELPKARLP